MVGSRGCIEGTGSRGNEGEALCSDRLGLASGYSLRSAESKHVLTFSNSILLINLIVAWSCSLIIRLLGSNCEAFLKSGTASLGRRMAS